MIKERDFKKKNNIKYYFLICVFLFFSPLSFGDNATIGRLMTDYVNKKEKQERICSEHNRCRGGCHDCNQDQSCLSNCGDDTACRGTCRRCIFRESCCPGLKTSCDSATTALNASKKAVDDFRTEQGKLINTNRDALNACKRNGGQCQAEQAAYDEAQKDLNQLNSDMNSVTALNEINQLNQEEYDSALTKSRRSKRRQQVFGVVAAAGTAALVVRTKQCFTACSSTGGGGCGPCYVLAGLAAAAGIQAVKIFDKAKDIEKTEMGLCELDPSNSFCLDSKTKDPAGSTTKQPTLPPNLKGGSLVPSPPVAGPNGGNIFCLNGDPDCLRNHPTYYNWPPSDEEIIKRIEEEAGVPDPDGTKRGGFSYETLNSKEKADVDKFLKKMNDEGMNYLQEQGIDVDEIDESKKNTLLGSAPSTSGSFSGGGSKGRSLASSPLPVVRKKKKLALSDEMSGMLKKFQNSLAGGGANNDFSKKSVQVGSDVVGVREDNIFMMVHRRHRALDGSGRFIKDAF